MTRSAAVGKLIAGVALAQNRPAAVVGVGSSTMEGYLMPAVEARWFTKLIRLLQGTFAGPPGDARSDVQYSSSAHFQRITSPGVHGYNAGQASTTSDSYLWSEEIDRISALRPVGIIHMVGSNDLVAGTDPAVVRRNIERKLDRFDVPSLCGHIYVHQHLRNTSTKPRYDWSMYRDAWLAIAGERPMTVGVLSVADIFAGLGIPGSDPRELLQSDGTHLEADGHTVMARLVYDLLMSA